MAKIVGKKAQEKSNIDTTVNMWVFEEVLEGRKLTEIINTEHENVKYLPGIPLPHNVRAVPDLLEAIKGATILIFVVPHQFIEGLCNQMKGHVDPGAKAVSLIKGVNVKEGDEGGLGLISQMISETLDIDVSVLMGANIANEVAAERFCESTVGYNVKENGELFRDLFDTPYFRITAIQDVAGVELCGALKNVVAVAAGLVDGLDLGNNTKAAIIRIGLMEMKRFAIHFYGGVREETFFESCGVADVITTCLGGRNRRISEARVRTGKVRIRGRKGKKGEEDGDVSHSTNYLLLLYPFICACYPLSSSSLSGEYTGIVL